MKALELMAIAKDSIVNAFRNVGNDCALHRTVCENDGEKVHTSISYKNWDGTKIITYQITIELQSVE